MRPGQDANGPYRVEVIADSSGKYVGNGLRFIDETSAIQYAYDLSARWTLVQSWRVVHDVDGVTRKGRA